MNSRSGFVALTLSLVLLTCAGCVERTARIKTHPTGALVTVNDEERGVSPVKFDFLWYGDYDIIIRKPGYKTLKTHYRIDAPWYEWPPLDVFAEVLVPTMIHDQRQLPTFELEPAEAPNREEVLERATELRDRAIYEGQ